MLVNDHVAGDAASGGHHERHTYERTDAGATTALSAIAVVIAVTAFQTNLLPYFAESLVNNALWPLAYYGYFIVVGTLAVFVMMTNASVRIASLPAVFLCAASLSTLTLHSIGWAEKNFIVAVGLCALITIVANKGGVLFVLRACAVGVLFNSALCFVDIMLQNGFTNTFGRAAGLAVGPNVAAAQILLGATVSWRAVPRKWQATFFAIVAGAIFVTLSRSMLLGTAMVGLVAASPLAWRICETRQPPKFVGTKAAVVTILLMATWVGGALIVNDRFSVALDSGYASLGKAKDAILDVLSLDNDGNVSDEFVARLKHEEAVDSASARLLLLQRAVAVYHAAPIFGVGLQAAHDLAPHNTYLLFAVAFGSLGIAIPIGFVLLPAMRSFVSGSHSYEFPAASAGIFMLSHDTLLQPQSTVIIALGFAASMYGVGQLRKPVCPMESLLIRKESTSP